MSFVHRENASEGICTLSKPKMPIYIYMGQADSPERLVQPKEPADSPHVRRSERLATIPPVYWGKRRRSTDSTPRVTPSKQTSSSPGKISSRKSGPRQAANRKTVRNTTPRGKYKTKKSTSAAVNKSKTAVGRWQVPRIYIYVCVCVYDVDLCVAISSAI